jgi:NADH:ubiquinone oxidoreductase subunit 2 (subunit N)
LDLIKNITSLINPYGTFVLLIFGIIISIFFGISKKIKFKNFIFIISVILLICSFFINIFGFILNKNFSNNLFTSGFVEVIAIAIILFFAIISIFEIYQYHKNDDNFIKIIMIFLFLVICTLLVIISKNFIAFFVSLMCFIISFFAVITLLNESLYLVNFNKIVEANTIIKDENKNNLLKPDTFRSILRFFIAILFFIVLLFFGFSILYGVTDVKNFLQLFQNIEPAGINIILSLIIISISFYVFLSFFPFQGPYISFTNKTGFSSLYLLWLFYFPTGIFALLKFLPIILILNKNEKASSYILYVLLITVFLSSLGSGLGGLKTKSLRKISSYIFTIIITGHFINMIMLISGFIKIEQFNALNIFYLILIASSFLPLVFIFISLENQQGKDSIKNINSLIYKDKFIGVSLLIFIFSLIGLPGFLGYIRQNYYLNFIITIFNNKTQLNILNNFQGWIILIILIIYTAAFLCIYLRLLISIFTRVKKDDKDDDDVNIKENRVIHYEDYKFNKKFYTLVGIFAAIVIILGVLILLEVIVPQFNLFGLRLTNTIIYK